MSRAGSSVYVASVSAATAPQARAVGVMTKESSDPCVHSRKVPLTARTMAITSEARGHRLWVRHTQTTMRIRPRYSRTVPVPAFDSRIAPM